MSINFQAVAGQKADRDVILSGMEADGRIMASPSKGAGKESEQVVATLNGSLFSDNAYAKHARSAEDINNLAQNTDVAARHNFMALLSNTLSEEDYSRAMENGFDLKDLNSEDTVNIVDKIKGALLTAGVEIAGFNDDLSAEKLQKITGSDTLGRAIANSFHENDVPVTPENVRSAKTAYEQIADITSLGDSSVKYMVLNNMSPTIENVYFAAHSTNGRDLSGRGFYAQETGGYYAQKADSYDWEQLDPQINKVIEEAGCSVSDTAVKDNAKWMVEQGIPLTAENLTAANTIKNIKFPISEELAAKSAAAAVSDGKRAIDGDLSDPVSNLYRAAKLVEETNAITDDNLKGTIISGKELTIRNMSASYYSAGSQEIAESDERLIKARIQLEEVRLVMTTRSNKFLLDSGYSIDTAPMEELIERLKALLGQEGSENEASVADLSRAKVTGANSSAIFSMSMRSISLISSGPCDVVGSISSRFESISLSEIAVTSAEMTRRFKAAGEGYETMMTAPRADLGDSIKKAFRNVDDILADMGEELTDENRRTLRILGYNSIEITKSSIEQVRACDQKMQATIERLKPGAVLDLIREGRNPLSMTIQELSDSLDQGETSDERKEKKDEKYSRFLYKLEKKGEITEKEKASFIGIYRLFHNLKRTDYRAIGALLKSGQDMTLGNLLTAMRTQQAERRGMDYTVDDEFGGLTAAGERTSARIDEQISAAFTYYRAKAEVVYENLEPEKLKEAAPTNQTLLPELADDLRNAAEDEALDREYARQQAQDMRNTAALRAADPALKELTAADIEVTFNNLEAMISNLRDRRDGKIWRDTEDRIGADTVKKQDELVDLLEEEDYEEKYVKILEDFSDKLTEELMGAQDTYVDVRAISLMHRQLSVMTQMARQQSYEIPVNIEGEKISMHVTLKRDESGSSRMDAGIQTIEYGFVAVSLYVKDGSIKGMLTTGNSQSHQQTEYLEDVRTRLCERLAEKIQDAGIGRENIAILYHAQTSPAVAGAFNTNATEGADTKLETQTLLKMAKAFIEAL